VLFLKKEELLNYIDKENLLQEYGGDDPFKYTYIIKSEREGTNFVPSWEMKWTKHRDDGDDDGEKVKKRIYRRPIMQCDSKTKNCNDCKKGFGWLKRKVHCKACGKIYCSTCVDFTSSNNNDDDR
jgi:hypothetical protein